MQTISTQPQHRKPFYSTMFMSFAVLAVLVAAGFFAARGLRNENIAETETSASNAADKVNYAVGEILVSFKAEPPTDVTTRLQQAVPQVSDLKLKNKVTPTIYLYESETLKNNSIIGINSGSFTSGKWGKVDNGMNTVLTSLNKDAKSTIPEFDFAEPNYKVETFRR